MLTNPTDCTFKLSITCDCHGLTNVTGVLLAIFRYQLILDIPKGESRGDGQVRRVNVKFFVDVHVCLLQPVNDLFVVKRLEGIAVSLLVISPTALFYIL